jgi:YidC/Oxa1 family membrane protein insertase
MWDLYVINPMINALLVLYDFLGNQFVVAIAVFTILIRLLTLPLTLRQQKSAMRMQEFQPQIQAIQKKYKDNPQRMQEEFRKIGYNPAESVLGCLPLLLQMPILIGLYRAIIVLLGSTPQALFELTQRVYDGIDLTALLPVSSRFLWLDLGRPDPVFILPIQVFVTMFVSQKLTSPARNKSSNDKKGNQQDDNPAAAMTQSMQYTMPIMFGFFSLQFQAGLSIYFVLSNIIQIGQSYYVRRLMQPAGAGSTSVPTAVATNQPANGRAVEKPAAKIASPPKRKHRARRPTSKRKRRSAKR